MNGAGGFKLLIYLETTTLLDLRAGDPPSLRLQAPLQLSRKCPCTELPAASLCPPIAVQIQFPFLSLLLHLLPSPVWPAVKDGAWGL